MEKIIDELQQNLAKAGFKSSIVSIQHVSDLRGEVENLLKQGSLKKDFYDEIISRYGLHWDFGPPTDLPTAKSVIITAAPQPKTSVKFTLSGKTFSVIIPPTYLYGTDKGALNVLRNHLENHGYKVINARLPTKLLAVHSGLASYGRNNIAYIDGWGSYFRLRAFFSDMPCTADNWQELEMMDFCKKCDVCIKRCPTNAITQDPFLIDAARCITYFNEGDDEFPEWIEPTWHNCLIGCMVCQDVCPANKEFTKWIVPGEEFSEDETQMLLKGVTTDELSPGTTEKLRKICMFDDYNLFKRNLGVLISKIEKAAKKT